MAPFFIIFCARTTAPPSSLLRSNSLQLLLHFLRSNCLQQQQSVRGHLHLLRSNCLQQQRSLRPPSSPAPDDMHDQISPNIESDDLWSSLSSYMDNKGGQDSSAASQSLMGLSKSLFNDVDTFLMDKEDPAEYIPAPPISVADLQMNNQLETVLYKLREAVPGPLVEAGMDKKFSEAWSFVSDDIKVQDPLLCLEGKERLWSWLCKLATMNVEVHLDEIYSERSRDDSFKGCIHAVWTLQFPKELSSISASSASECEGRSSLQLNLCGESKLVVDKSGQVMSIESNWFVQKGREEELDSIKLLLTSLLLKDSHN